MISSIALATRTPCSHSLTPLNLDHNDGISGDSSSTSTETSTDTNLPAEQSGALSVRKCEVIKTTETFIAKVKRQGKRLLSTVPEALCTPLKVCNTLLHVGIFAGYYVTVMTITGIGALTGAMAGVCAKVKASLTLSPTEKSIKQYTVSYRQKVFKWLALPYEKLPDMVIGSVFPVITSITLFIFETVAIPGKQIPMSVYEQVYSATYQATKPYKSVTDMTVNLFNATKGWIQN
ncbi:hypothetical protein [Endozoicomonas sp. SCSIO W0465]|uniref:hypothetical protein n=1 Tax=Endozoicomonas sp. SCSIO W0465 TaxID=2918516 RepID=UPI0020764F39|nr:hypothetical protein [Endozoicomonas sp. SCSIO W0465]USE37732.1 hypothetical protein MJO57_05915 [Endozoicomonas sp. SCSIO W0465]